METTSRRRGRPATRIDPTLVGALGWRGLRLEDIAEAMGVSRQCLHARFKADAELRDAYRIGHSDWHQRTMADAADLIDAARLVRAAARQASAA
jgi:hypothetical protein